MRTILQKLIPFFLLLIVNQCYSQKVAVIGTNNLTPDGFSFVVTKDLASGEVVYFTENEYSEAGNAFNSLEESVVVFTAGAVITKGNVIFVKEISTDVFSVICTGNNVCGTAVKTPTSGNFALATAGEGIYAYSDVDNDPTNGVTEIYSVFYTGNADQVPNINGGLIPTGQNPISDFPNAIVIHGFPALAPDRTEFKITSSDRTNVTKAILENPANYLHAQTNADLSTVFFTNLSLVPPLSLTFSAKTDVSCFGGSNGAASTNAATGGVPPYSYNWTPGNPTGDGTTSVTGLTFGTWTCTVTDGAGSTAVQTFNITQPNAIPTPNISSGSSTSFCSGGSVVLTSGSPGGNQWYINDNPIGAATNQDYTANASGTYTVVVTSSGCSSAPSNGIAVTVNPTSSTPTITAGSTTFCTGGSVVLSSSSVTGNQWYVAGSSIGGETNQTYTASASGSYTVVVTSGGCSSDPSLGMVVTVNVPTISDTTAAVCNKFTWHDSTYKISTNAIWHTTNVNGCDSTRTLHLTILSVTSTAAKTDASCFGTATGSIIVTPTYGVSPFTYRIGTVAAYGASNTFNNLRAGNYRVSILDANGCAGITSQVIITQRIAVTGTSVVTNATCHGLANGSITVTPTTGTAPHTYRLDNIGTFTTSNVFNNVSAGAYRVYIKDANSCVGSIVVSVTQPTKVSGTSTKTDETCPNAKNGSITVTGAGGTSPYSYRYGGTGSFTSNNIFNNLKAGSYRVYVNDANNCIGFPILTTVGQTLPICPVSTFAKEQKATETNKKPLQLTLSPNPSTNNFTLNIISSKQESVQLRIIDVNGKTVQSFKGTASRVYHFGDQFAPGIYLIEVKQGDDVKVITGVKIKP